MLFDLMIILSLSIKILPDLINGLLNQIAVLMAVFD